MPDKDKAKEPRAKIEDVRKAAEPLMKYLAENHHPHCKVIVTSTSVELLQGVCGQGQINDYLVD